MVNHVYSLTKLHIRLIVTCLLLSAPLLADDKPSLPVVYAIVYSAPDCAPCQKMKAELKKNLPAYGLVYGVDVLFDEDPKHLDQQLIYSTPTTKLWRNGKVVAWATGIVSAKDMAAWLREHRDGDQGRSRRQPK